MNSKNFNMEQYKAGDTVKVRTHGEDDFETWLILGISKMRTSGHMMMRVRHSTGFVGTIMLQNVAKIEKTKRAA
jgi:hypothetical protein